MKSATRKYPRKSDPRLADTRVIAGSSNVFIDLGFDEAEARVMALRVELMMRLRERLQEKGYTQVEAAKRSGASVIELHTGTYAEATGGHRARELGRLTAAARRAASLGLEVHAGHGLTFANVSAVAAIPEVAELNIGHFLIGEAVFTGLATAVSEMKRLMLKAREL